MEYSEFLCGCQVEGVSAEKEYLGESGSKLYRCVRDGRGGSGARPAASRGGGACAPTPTAPRTARPRCSPEGVGECGGGAVTDGAQAFPCGSKERRRRGNAQSMKICYWISAARIGL